MDQKQVKTVKALIKLMHEQGITHLKVGDIELSLPHPTPSIKSQIMRVSNQEFTQVAKKVMENHKGALSKMNDKPSFSKEDEFAALDEILFAHEKF